MAEVKTASLIIRDEEGNEFLVAKGLNEEIDFLLGEAGLCSKEEMEFLGCS